MFCNKCGADNPDDGAFCQKCGASLSAAAGSAPPKPTDVDARPGPGIVSQIQALPIKNLLLYGAIVVLVLSLLIAILDVAGMEHVKGSYKAAVFFEKIQWGIFFAGILAAFSMLIKKD